MSSRDIVVRYFPDCFDLSRLDGSLSCSFLFGNLEIFKGRVGDSYKTFIGFVVEPLSLVKEVAQISKVK